MKPVKRFSIPQWYLNYFIKELIHMYDNNQYKFMVLNSNSTIQMYTPWSILVADFYQISKDTIEIKLTNNWSLFDKDIFKSSILKTFNWEYMPENNRCFGYFAVKNRLKFKL